MTFAGPARRSTSAGHRLAVGVGAMALVGAVIGALVDPLVAVIAVVGALGAVAVYVDHRVGLIAVATFTALRLPDVATDYHGAPSLFTPLVALVVFSLLLKALRTGTPPPGGWRATAAVGGFGAVALFSLLFAADLPAGIRAFGFLAKDGAVAVLIGLLLTRAADLRLVVWVVVACGSSLAALTALQYVTGSFDTTLFGFAQSASQNIVGTTDDIRISGPIGDPNFYAQWLVMVVPLAIDRYRDEVAAPLRFAAAAATLACIASIVFTFSRGALIALAVVLAAMAVRHPPRVTTVVTVGMVAVLALPFLPSGYVDRMGALADLGGVDIGTDPSLRNRQTESAVAVAMFLDRPLTGIGYGNYLSSYTGYARDFGADLVRKPREAHNLYLETAAETGIAGVAALLAVIGAAYVALADGRRRFRAMGDGSSDGIGHAVGVAIVAYLLTSVFLHMAFARLAWLTLGIAFALPSLAASEDRHRTAALVST